MVPEYPHHVVQHGNRGQAVFIQDGDWSRYLDLVGAACLEVGMRVLLYCLTPNHVIS